MKAPFSWPNSSASISPGESVAQAVARGRDDLAREALIEKRRCREIIDALAGELSEYRALIHQYHQDIEELEGKLDSAKEKKRILIQRHKRASGKKRAQEEIRRMEDKVTGRDYDWERRFRS